MTSSIKLDDKLSELKAADVRLLIYGSLCHDGKIDSEKLATLASMKKTSANTNYWRAKHHLEGILGLKVQSPTQAVNLKDEDTNGGPTKKSRSGTKRGVAKDTSSRKADKAPKRRKTTAKSVPERAQDEKSSDADPADTADTADLTE
ncbi:hypothetical protein CBS147372_882 [Penicillium roqueforti]|nr:hypothetical protein CBS147372_882 [Penicillium roqueforti]